MGKQRSHITKFIAQNKLRQDFVPLLGVLSINSMQGREAKDVKLAYQWKTNAMPKRA